LEEGFISFGALKIKEIAMKLHLLLSFLVPCSLNSVD